MYRMNDERWLKVWSLLLFILITLTLILAGCGSGGSSSPIHLPGLTINEHPPSIEPIKATVRTTVPLAYAASVAMASVNGMAPPNASVSNTCSSFPCAALVTIEWADQSLPIYFEPDGMILVAGLWTSKDVAILTVSFVDRHAGSQIFPITNVSTFPAINSSLDPMDTAITIVYASIDINIETDPVYSIDLTDEEIQSEYERLLMEIPIDPTMSLGMDAWIVDVDNAGTVDEFSDDLYIINGAGQYVDLSPNSTSLLQLALAQTVVGPHCDLNPTEGLSVLQEIGVSSEENSENVILGTAMFLFGSECTGEAELSFATGVYLGSNGLSFHLWLSGP